MSAYCHRKRQLSSKQCMYYHKKVFIKKQNMYYQIYWSNIKTIKHFLLLYERQRSKGWRAGLPWQYTIRGARYTPRSIVQLAIFYVCAQLLSFWKNGHKFFFGALTQHVVVHSPSVGGRCNHRWQRSRSAQRAPHHAAQVWWQRREALHQLSSQFLSIQSRCRHSRVASYISDAFPKQFL